MSSAGPKLVWVNGCPAPLELGTEEIVMAIGRELVRSHRWPPGWQPEVTLYGQPGGTGGAQFRARITWVAAPPEPGEAKRHGGRPPIE